jgi:hypothetical protein
MSREDGSGLFDRWEARKRAVAEAEAAEAEEQARAARDAAAEANRQAAEAIDITALVYDDDFSPFLKIGVPAALRRQALRTLWRSNPVLANLDGLNDYDEDYRTVTSVAGAIKSTWEAGRGYAARAEEVRKDMEDRDTANRAARSEKADAPETVADAADEPDDAGLPAADVADAGPPAAGPPAPSRASLRQRLLGGET